MVYTDEEGEHGFIFGFKPLTGMRVQNKSQNCWASGDVYLEAPTTPFSLWHLNVLLRLKLSFPDV